MSPCGKYIVSGSGGKAESIKIFKVFPSIEETKFKKLSLFQTTKFVR